MDDSRKYKLALIGFIIMVVLNIAILATLWIMGPPWHRSHKSPAFRAEHFIERELDLSNEQTKAFEELRQEHMRQSRKIIGSMQQKREQLVHELQSDSAVSEAAVDSLTRAIGDDQTHLERAIFNHFRRLRGLCSEAQKKKFDHVMNELVHRFGPDRKANADSLSQ